MGGDFRRDSTGGERSSQRRRWLTDPRMRGFLSLAAAALPGGCGSAVLYGRVSAVLRGAPGLTWQRCSCCVAIQWLLVWAGAEAFGRFLARAQGSRRI